MSSEDTPRGVQGNSPTNPKNQPTGTDRDNSEIPPNATVVDDHPSPAHNQGNNADNEPNWRRRFRYIRDRFPKADVWLAFFTGILVIETYMTIAVLTRTDEALHKTSEAQQTATEIADRMREITEDNERAWVGPNDARIFDNKENGKPLKVAVSVMNSGRQPALANMYMILKRYSTGEWQSEAYKTDVYTWQTSCLERHFSDNLATRQIFPGFIPGSNTYNLTASSDKADPPFVVTDELIKESDVVVAFGCYVYEAFKITRRTIFCYYYDKNGDANHLAFCPVGQYAN